MWGATDIYGTLSNPGPPGVGAVDNLHASVMLLFSCEEVNDPGPPRCKWRGVHRSFLVYSLSSDFVMGGGPDAFTGQH